MLVRLIAPCLVVAAAALPQPSTATEAPDVDAQARQLFHSLMSPYCPGSLLADCPSSRAAALRDSVRSWLAAGRTPESIREDLVRIHGDDILASPPFSGLGSLAWLGAAAIFLGGLGVAAWWIHQRSAPGAAVTTAPATGDDDLRRRLHSELAAEDDP